MVMRMAHIEVWYRCPVCDARYTDEQSAIRCKNRHPIIPERWAVGKDGKAVKINEFASPDGKYGMHWALREADLSDFIEERKMQLQQE